MFHLLARTETLATEWISLYSPSDSIQFPGQITTYTTTIAPAAPRETVEEQHLSCGILLATSTTTAAACNVRQTFAQHPRGLRTSRPLTRPSVSADCVGRRPAKPRPASPTNKDRVRRRPPATLGLSVACSAAAVAVGAAVIAFICGRATDT